jgi:hypothetical protein
MQLFLREAGEGGTPAQGQDGLQAEHSHGEHNADAAKGCVQHHNHGVERRYCSLTAVCGVWKQSGETLFPYIRLLIPELDRERGYNMKATTLAK